MTPRVGARLAKNAIRNLTRHAAARVREYLGAPEQYCIRGGYVHRAEASHFDDTGYRDEYQREVYVRAAELAAEGGVHTVYDVGCGSGYKLINYLGNYKTLGFEVPVTVEFLRRTYPDRQWASVSFSDRNVAPADIVVCSDVIEHVLDPNELMRFLVSVTRKWLVLSTPDREREYGALSPFQLGPPHTDHHIREWSFKEFHRYVSLFVEIREHRHTHPTHATQMIVGAVQRVAANTSIQSDQR